MASEKVKLTIHTAKPKIDEKAPEKKAARIVPVRKKLSFQDKLLRSSCIACALLLGILALENIQQPWAKNASATIEKALTMEIDLDKSIGQLSFVQKLMPESALVFFNLNGDHELTQPVRGELTHAYSETQPWLMFQTEVGSSVCAAADGIVSAVSPMSDGGYGILIDHGNGLESVTACITEPAVQAGASVIQGGIIGASDQSLFFELRENGKSIDPTERMGL